ncbi:MAG: putative hydrolase of the HAD superfamily, partial [Spirochaetes bacterium]
FQKDSQVERLARHLGITTTQAQDKLKAAKETHKTSSGGATSMANHFLSFGVDMETIIRWRIEEFDPRRWLSPNPILDAALAALSSRYRLGLLTNNPRFVGERSLEALGVKSRFEHVVGLDDSFESKPNRAPFDAFLKRMGIEAAQCLSVGDREDVDLRPALALGMGAVLVGGVEDVCRLPQLLGCA